MGSFVEGEDIGGMNMITLESIGGIVVVMVVVFKVEDRTRRQKKSSHVARMSLETGAAAGCGMRDR